MLEDAAAVRGTPSRKGILLVRKKFLRLARRLRCRRSRISQLCTKVALGHYSNQPFPEGVIGGEHLRETGDLVRPELIEVASMVSNTIPVYCPRRKDLKGLVVSLRMPSEKGFVDAPAETDAVFKLVREDSDFVMKHSRVPSPNSKPDFQRAVAHQGRSRFYCASASGILNN